MTAIHPGSRTQQKEAIALGLAFCNNNTVDPLADACPSCVPVTVSDGKTGHGHCQASVRP